MKTILVPTDFSLAADNALSYAIPIAIREKAKIILVHAYKIDPIYSRVAFHIDFIRDEISHAERAANHHLNLKCDWIKENSYGVMCEHISMLGQATDVILKAIKREKPYIVIMGTKGASGFNGLIIGSNAARIIGNAPCPVIAVPFGAKYHGIDRIAFTTDFHHNDVYAIKKLKGLNILSSAHTSFINIYNGAFIEEQKSLLKKFKEIAEKRFGKKNHSFRMIVGNNLDEELSKIAGNKHYDLLAMTTRHRSLFEAFFNRSMTKKIAHSTQIPLLAFKTR
jgi:nucleotide-binding universal stress UspA family protein